MKTVNGLTASNLLRTYFDSPAVKNIVKSDLKVLILVSVVGNKFCEQDFFKATVRDAIAQFKEVTFLIVDSLLQYNEQAKAAGSNVEVSADTFEKIAISLGDQWFERNIGAFISLRTKLQNKLGFEDNTSLDEAVKITNRLLNLGEINFNILRWDDWIKLGCNQCKYDEKKQLFMEKLEIDSHLKAVFEADQEAFASRYPDNKELWRKASESFLKEEVPAVEFISAGLGYNIVGYAGKQLETFKEVEKKFIVNEHPYFFGWVGIFFKKTKAENSGRRKNLNMPFLMEDLSSLKSEADFELIFAATYTFLNCLLNNENYSMSRDTITEETASFVAVLIKFLKEKEQMSNEDFQNSISRIKSLFNKQGSHQNKENQLFNIWDQWLLKSNELIT